LIAALHKAAYVIRNAALKTVLEFAAAKNAASCREKKGKMQDAIGEIKCTCGRKWQAMFYKRAEKLECPSCHNMVSIYVFRCGHYPNICNKQIGHSNRMCMVVLRTCQHQRKLRK
jgi:hypothetical protein